LQSAPTEKTDMIKVNIPCPANKASWIKGCL